MASPSPYQIGQQAANAVGRGFRENRDNNAIESILSQAMSSGDPAVIQNSIGKILSQVSPERQGTAVQYLQNTMQNIQQKQAAAKQEKEGRQAAEDSGYTYGAPAGVQTQQVRDAGRDSAINSFYGGAGMQASPNSQMGGIGIESILGNDQGQQVQPPFALGQQPQQQISPPQTQPNPESNSPFRRMSDEQIQIAQGSPYREISEPAKAEERRRTTEKELGNKDKIASRKEILDFHKESEKYDEDLFKQNKAAKKQVEALSDIDKALSSGNVKPTSLANIFKGFGKIGDKISEALLNNDQAAILTSIPQLLEGWKEVFGVRLTDADLKLLQDKMPSIGKNEGANRSIVKILKKYSDMTLLRGKIAREIKEANGGLRPLGYADKVEDRMDQMLKPIKIINPSNGREIEIPAYKLSDALGAGARLANE